MARFFSPDDHGDDRLHAPATARNREAIANVLKRHLSPAGTLLEIASGTGEHAAHLAPLFSPMMWQPTDIDAAHIKSIDAWRRLGGADNILPARTFDVVDDPWEFNWLDTPVTAVLAVNLLHIAPQTVTEALMAGVGNTLSTGGTLVTYGPYKRGGRHTAPSNEQFDQSLRARNPLWGVRDMEVVTDLAAAHSLQTVEIVPMPANNFCLVFVKA